MAERKKQTIVVVEDEKILLAAMKEELAQLGYTVYGAADGEEGLKVIQEQKPDLVLLDILMPKKDGMAVLRDMKADDTLKSVPVVVLTNLSDYDKISEALALGARDYLVKANYRLEDLGKKIAQIFERKT
jgi:CheY-like chemotaxis protein